MKLLPTMHLLSSSGGGSVFFRCVARLVIVFGRMYLCGSALLYRPARTIAQYTGKRNGTTLFCGV